MDWLARLVRRAVRASIARPRLTLALWLGLTAGALGYSALGLAFKTSTLDLLPPDQPYAIRYREYARDFGELEDIVVAVQAPTPAEARAYAARLAGSLRAGLVPLRRIVYRIETEPLERRSLLYLPLEDLRALRDRLLDGHEVTVAFAATPTLDRLVDAVNARLAGAFVSHFFDVGLAGGGAGDLDVLDALLVQLAERIEGPGAYRSPWDALLPRDMAADVDEAYFFSDDKRLLFVLIEPASGTGSFTNDRAAIDGIRRTIAALRAEFPGVSAGVTGAPTLTNDEMLTAFRDSAVATSLAFVLTLALLLLAFRQVVRPLLILAVLAASLACSLGVTALVIGHLTVFSIMFISIVIGIGIDYGIYVLFRAEEEVARGAALPEALVVTASRTGPGVVLSALTATATFYVLIPTEFLGVREFGFVSGTALLLAWAAMVTLFPALLVLTGHGRARVGSPPARPPGPGRAIEWIAAHSRPVLIATALLTIPAVWAAREVGFAHDLLSLQAEGTESVTWERRILATAGRSAFTALLTATSLAEAEAKEAALARLPSVATVDSVLRLVPRGQDAKLPLIREVATLVADVRPGGAPRAVDLERLGAALATLGRRARLAAELAGAREAAAGLARLRARIDALLPRLATADRGARARLDALQSQVARDFATTLGELRRRLDARPITVDDVPSELRRKWVGRSGRLILEVHPRANIWDPQSLAQFVGDIRGVDADVTGAAVVAWESMRLLETTYRRGALAAFVLVGLIVLVTVRRLGATVLALLPLALGMLWTLGLMRLFDVDLNFANVWGLPLIIGASAEYGLNLVLRAEEERARGGPLLGRSTVMAVVLNALTTVAGFGSLLVARHRGIWSLGLLLSLGTLASLAAALLVLPALLRRPARLAREPRTVSPRRH